MTKAERKALLKRLMVAAKAHGWGGGADESKAAKFLKWTEDNSVPFVDKDGDEIDIKALVVEQPSANQVVITEVDDEAPEDTNEMEGEMDEEEPKNGLRLAKEIKALRAEVGLLKSQAKDFGRVPQVAVKTAEESEFDAQKRLGKAAFGDYRLAKGFAYLVQSVARLQAGNPVGANDAKAEMLKFMDRAGLDTKAYATKPISAGGAYVPDQFIPDLLHLVDDYGVARQIANVVPMTSDSAKRPRKTGIMDIIYPDEGGTATDQALTSDLITLTAKKGIGFSRMSSEILEDAAIDIAAEVARDIARGIAFVEDNTLINGDGTAGSTGDRHIPGVLGYLSKFGTAAPSGSDARGVEGGATADATTIAHLYTLVSLLPTYAANSQPIFLCSPQMDALIFQRLAGSVGGMTRTEFAGRAVNSFLGYPIVHIDTMPKSRDAGADRVDVLFGAFPLSCMMGLRKDIELVTSDQRYFDTDQIAIRGRVRHDINVHDVGSASLASPVVALWQT